MIAFCVFKGLERERERGQDKVAISSHFIMFVQSVVHFNVFDRLLPSQSRRQGTSCLPWKVS